MIEFIKNNKAKTFCSILGFLLFLSTVLVFSLPSILSTEWGNQQLIKLVNERIPGKLQAKKISLSHWSDQSIENLSFIDETKGLELSLDSLKLQTNLFQLLFYGPQKGNLVLQGLNVHLVKNQDSQPIHISITETNAELIKETAHSPSKFLMVGLTQQDHLTGKFNIEGEFTEDDMYRLLNASQNPENFLDLDATDSIHFTLEASNFPLSILDQFVTSPKHKKFFTQLFGETMNLSLREIPTPQGIQFHLKATSDYFQGNLQGKIESRTLFLTEPASLHLNLLPEALPQLTQTNYQLESSTPIDLTIDKTHLPLKFKNKRSYMLDLSELEFLGKITIPQFTLQDKKSLTHTAFNFINVQMEAKPQSPVIDIHLKSEALQNQKPIQISLNTAIDKTLHFSRKNIPGIQLNLAQVPTFFLDHFFEMDSTLIKTLGPYLNLNIQALSQKGTTDVTLNINSENLDISQAHFVINEDLNFVTPIQLNYRLSKELTNHLLSKDSSLQLENDLDLQMQLKIDPIPNFQNIESLSQLKINGLLTIDKIGLVLNPTLNSAVLENLELPWEINGLTNQIHINLSGYSKLHEDQESGNLQGSLEILNWLNSDTFNLVNAKIKTKVHLTNFPVALLDTFSRRNDLALFLGEAINVGIDSHIVMGNSLKGHADIRFAGQGIAAEASISIGDNISLNREAKAVFTLTAPRFDALRLMLKGEHAKNDHLNLAEIATVNFTIPSFIYPLKNKSAKTHFNTDLSIDKLVIVDTHDDQKIHFNNIAAHLEAEDLRSILFNLTANQLGSHLHFSGHLDNAFDEAKKFNIKTLSLNLDSNVKDLPASFLCRIACSTSDMREKIEALFGEKIDAQLKISLNQLTGPIKTSIKGSNGHIELDGQLTSGTLTLNQSFDAAFTLTPQLGKTVLQEIFPILSGIIHADEPLNIHVDHAGFSVPLMPFNPAQLQIGQATLKLGKILFRTDGQLGEILSLLNPSKAEKISVWFTPFYLNVQNGALNLQRTDMLIANTYPIATWGNVDFVKDKVNLIVGLTGQAISRAFHVKVDNSYLLQLPLKGTTSKAELDKRKAATKISAFVAQSQGTPHGLVIGTVLNIAGGGLTEPKAPAPTTNPLPWAHLDTNSNTDQEIKTTQETTTESSQPSTSKKSKGEKKKNKEIFQDEAGKIIKGFFK